MKKYKCYNVSRGTFVNWGLIKLTEPKTYEELQNKLKKQN